MPDIAWSGSSELRAYHDVAAVHTTHGSDGIFPDDFQKKMRQGYSAATSYVDAQVGKVMRALNQYGHADNTIVALLGDHGWHLGDNGEWCKHTNFDMALRIPMMLYVPGVTSVGHYFPFVDALAPDFHKEDHVRPIGSQHSTGELVEALDLYPTLIELAGLPVPRVCPQDSHNVHSCTEGTSLVPLVRKVRDLPGGEGFTWKQAAHSQYLRNAMGRNPFMGYTVRSHGYRYTEWYPYDKTRQQADLSSLRDRELYQHDQDPDEFHNLADVAGYSDEVHAMAQILHDGWRQTLEDYLNTLNN